VSQAKLFTKGFYYAFQLYALDRMRGGLKEDDELKATKRARERERERENYGSQPVNKRRGKRSGI